MMKFCRFLGLIFASALLLALMMPVISHAGESGRKIYILQSRSSEPYMRASQALKKELENKGYEFRADVLEGKTPEELRARFNQMDSSSETIFVAVGSEAAQALHLFAPAGAKLYYNMVADPQRLGIHKNPAMTGVSTDINPAASFDFLKDILPKTQRIGILYQKESSTSRNYLQQLQAAAQGKAQIVPVAVEDYANISQAIAALTNASIDIIWTYPEAAIYNSATVRSLLLTGLRRNIPVFGFSSAFVRAGALLGVAIEPEDQGKQLATVILKEASQPVASGQIFAPVFRTGVNKIVLNQLGVTPEPSALKRVDFTFGR